MKTLYFFLSLALLIVYVNGRVIDSKKKADYKPAAFTVDEENDTPLRVCGQDLLELTYGENGICSKCVHGHAPQKPSNEIPDISDMCCSNCCRPSQIRKICCAQEADDE